MQWWLILPGIPLAALTAIYTAYLFAQAKARDMWQNPLLPPHMLAQAMLLGSAVVGLLAVWLQTTTNAPGDGAIEIASALLALTTAAHLLVVWGEISLTHPTAHARLAIHEMVRGRYASDFWIGVVMSVIGGLLPLLALFHYIDAGIGIAGAPFALVGMMLYEHAYVQAGQSVPLA